MTIVVIGDIGPIDGVYHAGNEAMLEALLDGLRDEGFESFTVVSANPGHSQASFGVPAVNRIGFDVGSMRNRREREERLTRVVSAAAGVVGELDWQDPAWRVIEAIAASDGVVVAGAGSLSSIWPEQLYERSAIVAIAEIFGKPVVVSGQTLGPAVFERDGELLAEMLGRATIVALREETSHILALRLGVEPTRIHRTLDDAANIVDQESDLQPDHEYCVVTISAHTGSAEPELHSSALARLLDRVVVETGLPIVFLPYEGRALPAEDSGDAVKHAEIANLMTSTRTTLLPVLPARQIARITRNASLSIATRYHSVVFALSAGVPAIGISVDAHTASKIGGAMENLGVGEWSLPMITLPSGHATTVLLETWSRRQEIREFLGGQRDSLQAESRDWWKQVAAVLRGQDVAFAPRRPQIEPLALDGRDEAEHIALLAAWSVSESTHSTAMRLLLDDEREASGRLELDIVDREREVGELHASLMTAEQKIREADAAAIAAHELMSTIAEPLFQRTLSAHLQLGSPGELQALMNTRTFRWTRRARSIYSRLRKQRGRDVVG